MYITQRRDESPIVAASSLATHEYNSDVRVCRNLLNIDPLHSALGNSVAKLEMACAHDVIENELANGEKRSIAAEKAYNQCMPKLNACDNVLIERPK
jgi:hypothetical protein